MAKLRDRAVQLCLNTMASRRPFKRWIAKFGELRVVITDKLRSYIKPTKTLAPGADYSTHKVLNNANEVSHRTRNEKSYLADPNPTPSPEVLVSPR